MSAWENLEIVVAGLEPDAAVARLIRHQWRELCGQFPAIESGRVVLESTGPGSGVDTAALAGTESLRVVMELITPQATVNIRRAGPATMTVLEAFDHARRQLQAGVVVRHGSARRSGQSGRFGAVGL